MDSIKVGEHDVPVTSSREMVSQYLQRLEFSYGNLSTLNAIESDIESITKDHSGEGIALLFSGQPDHDISYLTVAYLGELKGDIRRYILNMERLFFEIIKRTRNHPKNEWS